MYKAEEKDILVLVLLAVKKKCNVYEIQLW